MGIRPEATGQGLGSMYVSEVFNFARDIFNPTDFRVTIAKFNKRAQRVWENIGFECTQQFSAKGSGKKFLVFVFERTIELQR